MQSRPVGYRYDEGARYWECAQKVRGVLSSYYASSAAKESGDLGQDYRRVR